jgi:hypothetical protein
LFFLLFFKNIEATLGFFIAFSVLVSFFSSSTSSSSISIIFSSFFSTNLSFSLLSIFLFDFSSIIFISSISSELESSFFFFFAAENGSLTSGVAGDDGSAYCIVSNLIIENDE